MEADCAFRPRDDNFSSDAQAVKRRIEEAFANTRYVGDEHLYAEGCNDSSELDAVVGRFDKAHWREIPAQLIDELYGSLPFFSPAAFRFFLPAYIVRAVDTSCTANPVLEFLIYNLAPLSTKRAKSLSERIEVLTQAQRHAVYSFLKFVQNQFPTRMAHYVLLAADLWKS